ncbi:MAG: formate dehydrogenase accessory protein FdhE [Firmicutes bacterium]|nr:formate dehydrogenase accessory protein FdhE [Bacillota bacterium]
MTKETPVHLPEGYLDFFMQLESWQNKQQISLQKRLEPVRENSLNISEATEPLLNIIDIDFDVDTYQKLYTGFLDFMLEDRSELSADLSLIRTAQSQFDWPSIIEEITNENRSYFTNLANLYQLNPEVLLFTAEHSLRPLIRAFARLYYESWLEIGVKHWNSPASCPFCGSDAHISRIRNEDGRRFMFCERCFTEWEVRYLYCVHCNNDEPGSIRIMNLENDTAHKLYLCEKCKSYMKTYDERQTLQTVDMYIASVQTIYLDLLAEEKGYNGKSATNNNLY